MLKIAYLCLKMTFKKFYKKRWFFDFLLKNSKRSLFFRLKICICCDASIYWMHKAIYLLNVWSHPSIEWNWKYIFKLWKHFHFYEKTRSETLKRHTFFLEQLAGTNRGTAEGHDKTATSHACVKKAILEEFLAKK